MPTTAGAVLIANDTLLPASMHLEGQRGEIGAVKKRSEGSAGNAKMRFTMMGFDQDAGVRQYAFQGTADGILTGFTVGVELALIPRYGIRIQELPLLCRGLLERQGEGEEKRTLTFTEEEMRVHADICATVREAAAQKKRLARRPPPANVEAAWRAH
jgi:hypothetical protein